ncbi:hypothetical protein MLD38_015459 [Melastoma candidum]|uniref:Uncharacterized protein n=1 Tax=Melastoma candidum TaxID=119954 RepID=A0ACB9RPM7_9MYRT|nr:hypothetical protein MLD38_015459 [Melastoma candidum]
MTRSMEKSISTFSALLYMLLPLTFATKPPSNVTALFVFGDSTVDPGNNNYIPTTARADHLPYGRDLPNHEPSGRNTNGKLVTDFLASYLGLKELLPAYLDPRLSEKELISGVSFASAGMGLDEITCRRSNVLNMSTQLDNFDEAVKRMQRMFGPGETMRIVSDAIFILSAGTNDMLVNAYNLRIGRSNISVTEFHDFLLQNTQLIIQRLYEVGARKIAIVGHPPIGCLPLQVTLSGKFPRSCIDSQNKDSQDFNSKLGLLLSTLQSNLTEDTKLNFLDIYTPVMDMINEPASFGFETTLRGCCGTGLFELGSSCNIFSPTCPDASKYVFFDAVHPSEAASEHVSKTMYESLARMIA